MYLKMCVRIARAVILKELGSGTGKYRHAQPCRWVCLSGREEGCQECTVTPPGGLQARV